MDNDKADIGDVQVVHTDPNIVRFTPLSEDGTLILGELISDLVFEGVANWRRDSAYVEDNRSYADYVYQSLLIAGLTVRFPNGGAMQVDPADVETQIQQLPADLKAAIRASKW